MQLKTLQQRVKINILYTYVLFDLCEPLILEAVEGVEETLVDQVEGGAEDLDGDEREDLALHQEDHLHHDAEDGVGDHHGDGQVDQWPSL